MEPKAEVLKHSLKRFSRRSFLKYPVIFGAGLLVGKLTAPCPLIAEVTDCPDNPVIPPPPAREDLSSRFGLHIPNDGSFDPVQIMETGAGWIRFVAMQEDKVDPTKILEYLARCRQIGIKSLAVVAKESIGDRDLKDAARFFAQVYDGAVDAWQIGNEPDDTNPDGKWSWKMDGVSFTSLLWIFRNAMGQKAYLVAGGLDTNRLEYLQDVDLSWVNALAIHPYGQGLPDWPSPYGFPGHIGLMVDKYFKYANIFGKKLWITEWGINHDHFGENYAADYIRKMLTYLRDSVEVNTKVDKIFYYNLFDQANQEFSLVHTDYTKKPSYYAFKDVALGKTTAVDPKRLDSFSDLSHISPFPG
ncbi:hypothetical protein HYW46_02605 [Candidatus Daviesbacteria bacterium]|nr:hypothetical protein [Candidatus Daviesbacteria bacterium]